MRTAVDERCNGAIAHCGARGGGGGEADREAAQQRAAPREHNQRASANRCAAHLDALERFAAALGERAQRGAAGAVRRLEREVREPRAAARERVAPLPQRQRALARACKRRRYIFKRKYV